MNKQELLKALGSYFDSNIDECDVSVENGDYGNVLVKICQSSSDPEVYKYVIAVKHIGTEVLEQRGSSRIGYQYETTGTNGTKRFEGLGTDDLVREYLLTN